MLILIVSFTLGQRHQQRSVCRSDDTGRRTVSPHPSPGTPGVLWWALLLGTVLGGNLTPVGASANIVAVGIAKRARPSRLLLGLHPTRGGG